MNTNPSWNNTADTELPEFEGTLLLWHFVVMPMMPPQKTKGGLILPDEAKDFSEYQNRVGRVVDIGPYCYNHPKYAAVGMKVQDQLKQIKRGDWVMFGQHQPFRIEQNGVKLIIMNDDEIIAKIANPDSFKAYIYRS